MSDISNQMKAFKDSFERKILAIIAKKLRGQQLTIDETTQISQFVISEFEQALTLQDLHQALSIMNQRFPKMSSEVKPLLSALNQIK